MVLIDRQVWKAVELQEEEEAKKVRELIRRHLLANNGGNGGISDWPKVNGRSKQRDGF